ncbi:hypothetical protein [Paractinoplanes ferrugineus]|nr:hypothetical protein [Actinoplanes ferrugineus]
MPSLFAPKVPDNKANPLFLNFRDSPAFRPARVLMDAIYSQYRDKDGSFIQEFQTRGFSARVWELSLFAYLQEAELEIDESFVFPDYVITAPHPMAIEAATSQPAENAPKVQSAAVSSVVPSDLVEGQRELVFQVAKALRRKLLHRNAAGLAYWQHPHTAGRPFVIAVEAFHNSSSLFYSDAVIIQYLYGQRPVGEHDELGTLTIKSESIGTHHWKGREIPSGLFDLPEAADLSAVLFSNGSTVSQFNRIAVQEGIGLSEKIIVMRLGTCLNRDPNASEPAPFEYIVGEADAPYESFSQVLTVMHNPNAKVPLPDGAFPNVAECRLEDDGRLSVISSGFHPFTSITQILTSAKRHEGEVDEQ